ncbi:MAG: DNA recombination protein RmuC [Methermicoccaceae archaeon]
MVDLMFFSLLVLGTVITVLLGITVIQQRRIGGDIEHTLESKLEGTLLANISTIAENALISTLSKNPDILKGAFATSLQEMGMQENISRLTKTSEDIQTRSERLGDMLQDLKLIFDVKQSRGVFGERLLENILKDMFPSQKLRFQSPIGSGEKPDASLYYEEGQYLCIDSKFPLENFRKAMQAEEEGQKERYWKNFLSDLRKHIEAVRSKYISQPDTVDFALLFVPSDAIFYEVANKSPDVIEQASRDGVIMCSPTILPMYLSLLSAKIKTDEISERAIEITHALSVLKKDVDKVFEQYNKAKKQQQNSHSNMVMLEESLTNLRNHLYSVTSVDWAPSNEEKNPEESTNKSDEKNQIQ